MARTSSLIIDTYAPLLPFLWKYEPGEGRAVASSSSSWEKFNLYSAVWLHNNNGHHANPARMQNVNMRCTPISIDSLYHHFFSALLVLLLSPETTRYACLSESPEFSPVQNVDRHYNCCSHLQRAAALYLVEPKSDSIELIGPSLPLVAAL